MKFYLNEAFVEEEAAQELLEPGFLFGWGVFEALRTYGRRPAFLGLHVERLNRSLGLIGIEEAKEDFAKIIEQLLLINDLKDAYVRINAYKKRDATGVIVYASKFGYYPAVAYERGFSGITSPYRLDTHSLSFKVKSLSYLEKRLAWHGAQKKGKDEALILSQEGFLAGGSRSNLFLLEDKKALIPSAESGVFGGITQKIVRQILQDMGIKTEERKLTVDDIGACEEAFLTSSLLEVMPLVEHNDRPLGKGIPGEVTREVVSRYRKIVHG